MLADSDVVLSTYHTISHEAKDKTSPLWKLKWFRIILDEGKPYSPYSWILLWEGTDDYCIAHIIRRMTTNLFKSIRSLHSCFRWCLTGTPVQNTLEDLVALVTFIRSTPLDDIHKFRKTIISPILRNFENGEENLRVLLDSICLRRTKQLLNLPCAKYETRVLDFSAKEEQQYTYTRDEMIKKMRQNTLHAKTRKGQIGVFQILLRLRRLCNHGTFQKLSLDAEEFDPEQAITQLKKDKESKCELCSVKITELRSIRTAGERNGVFTTCGHLLCMKCLPKVQQELQRAEENDACFKCSLCSQMILGEYLMVDEALVPRPKVGDRRLPAWQYFETTGCSTKVLTLVKDIQRNENDGKW